jgi:serine/threonine-protein kinase
MPLCVIKQLCPKVDNPIVLQRAIQRFEREAAMLGQLGNHAQIPHLLDYFQEAGEFYLVQEYVKGHTIGYEVKQKGHLFEPEVKRFLQEILPVLKYIHRHRVIHRDIKPPNILRSTEDGRLVLIDFGAVKEQLIEPELWQQRGTTTHFVGTLGFAPPEQLALRSTYSSDIYALGMTCLYLLTGKPPGDLDVDLETGKILWRRFVKVSDYFGRVLDQMLQIAPRDRFQSADEVMRALELEPYLESLANCMTVVTPTAAPPAMPLPDDLLRAQSGEYLAPFVRAAIEIRRWRSQLRQIERRQAMRERVAQEAERRKSLGVRPEE